MSDRNSQSAQFARLFESAPNAARVPVPAPIAPTKYDVKIVYWFNSSYINTLPQGEHVANQYRNAHLHYAPATLLEELVKSSSSTSLFRKMEYIEGVCFRSIPVPIEQNQQRKGISGTGLTRAEVGSIVETFVTIVANRGVAHLKNAESDNYHIYITNADPRRQRSSPTIERKFVVFRTVDWKALVAEYCSRTEKDFLLAQLMSIE